MTESRKEYSKRYYEENKEKIKERAKKRYLENPEEANERARKYYRKRKKERHRNHFDRMAVDPEYAAGFYPNSIRPIRPSKGVDTEKRKLTRLKRKEYLKTNSPNLYLYRIARTRAKNQNVSFQIEVEDIIVPEKCPILGIDLFFTDGKLTDNTPTLDKVKPKLGYVKGNVAVISNRANRLKSCMNKEELLSLLEYMESFE